MRFQLVNWFPVWRGFYFFRWHKAMKKLGIDKIQFIWFLGGPVLHWWAYPPNFREHPVFKDKPIMWRLGLGWVEIRVFPTRNGL